MYHYGHPMRIVRFMSGRPILDTFAALSRRVVLSQLFPELAMR